MLTPRAHQCDSVYVIIFYLSPIIVRSVITLSMARFKVAFAIIGLFCGRSCCFTAAGLDLRGGRRPF